MREMGKRTTFYLVRHAQSEARAKNIVQGVGLPVPLSMLGKEQVKEASIFFKGFNFNRIFSSKAIRAIHTAKAIREFHPDLPYEEVMELNERSKGEAEGMSKDDFAKKYPDIIKAWQNEGDPSPAGGESFSDVEKRAVPFLEKHLKEFEGQDILYVGHGNTFRVLIGYILGSPAGMRNRIKLDYCALSVISYDHTEERWHVEKVNQPVLRDLGS